MKYTYKVYRQVNEIDKPDWEAVIHNTTSSIFLDHRFLATVEKSFGTANKCWYVLFYYQETPIACCVYTLFSVDIATVAGSSIKKCIKGIRKVAPSFLTFNALFCGIPVSVGQSPFVCIDNRHVDALFPLVEGLMEDISKQEKHLLKVYKEFTEEECALVRPFLQARYICAHSLPMHYCKPLFSSFADYYASLKAEYRNSVKRAQKKFENKGMKIIQTHDAGTILAYYTPDVHKLYLAVVEQAEHKLEIMPQSFFLELVKNFPDQVYFTFAVDPHEKVVGFNCSLYDGTGFHFIFCGMDYAINYESNLYYNLIYNSLDQAFRLDCQVIQVGQTTDDFKARLGCNATPLYLYVRFNVYLLQAILKKIFTVLFPQRKVKSYTVFKEKQKWAHA